MADRGDLKLAAKDEAAPTLAEAEIFVRKERKLKQENLKLAIVGLGYVGLPLAVEFGKKRPVIGFDINEKRIAGLSLAMTIL